MTKHDESARIDKLNPGGQAGSTNLGQNAGDAGMKGQTNVRRDGKKHRDDQPGAAGERSAGAEEDTYD